MPWLAALLPAAGAAATTAAPAIGAGLSAAAVPTMASVGGGTLAGGLGAGLGGSALGLGAQMLGNRISQPSQSPPLMGPGPTGGRGGGGQSATLPQAPQAIHSNVTPVNAQMLQALLERLRQGGMG